MCALESSGGSGTTTAGGSSSAGTSEVAGLTIQGTAPSDAEFVAEGSGTVNVSNTTFNTIRVASGATFIPAATVTIFQTVGTLTRPGALLLSLIDNFGDATIEPVFLQFAAGDTLSEANGLFTTGFATGADARFTFGNIELHPHAWTRSPYNIYSIVAALDSITFTTPAAGDIYAGLYILIGDSGAGVERVFVGIAAERRSGGSTNLVTFEINDDDSGSGNLVSYANRTVLASTDDVWLRIDVLGDASGVDPRAYYRTSAPARADSTYTLLGSLTHTSTGVSHLNSSDFFCAIGAWETQNSDGVVTANWKTYQIIPQLGPG